MEIPRVYLSKEDIDSGGGYLKQFSVTETFQLHTHSFYEFFYICKGKCIHEINNTNQLLVQGSLVFIRPEDIHRFDFFNQYDIHIISCGIVPELMERVLQYMETDSTFLTSSLLPPCIILEGKIFTDMEHKLDMLGSSPPGQERKVYFLSLLPELLYLFLTSQPPKSNVLPIWMNQLLSAMNEPRNFVSGLDSMLQLSNISQEHLTREFRRRLGMTPTEYINFKRVSYASELLLQQKYEILDICYMSGFNNLTYFYKIFRKQYNCTPREFVKMHGRYL